MDYDVFISHATPDKTVAKRFCESLEAAGLRCWIAPRNLLAGNLDGYGAALVQGVRESRVLLLVFSAAANKSLHVMREVERALSERKPILPVRVEECEPTGTLDYVLHAVHRLDAVAPPLEAHLPGVIETIRQLLAAAGGDSSTTQREGGPGGRSARGSRREIPALLHYHCDRDDQESQLEEALKCGEANAPLVCIIHGDEDQCHDKFLERLSHITLPRVHGLDQEEVPVKEYAINYPANFADARKFRDRLLRNLGLEVLNRSVTKAEEIADVFARLAVPVVIQAGLLTDEWLRGGRASVDPFLGFWADWPGGESRYRLLVCLRVTYRLGPRGWFGWYRRLILRRANARLRTFLCSQHYADAARPGVVLLDELRGVTQNELEAWSLAKYTQQVCGDRDLLAEVRALCGRPGFRDREGRIAMVKVAGELKRLLGQDSVDWETC
jgi:hypothetical protein